MKQNRTIFPIVILLLSSACVSNEVYKDIETFGEIGNQVAKTLAQVDRSFSLTTVSSEIASVIPSRYHGIWNAPGKCEPEDKGLPSRNIFIEPTAITPAYYRSYYLIKVLENGSVFTALYELRGEEGSSEAVTFSLKANGNNELEISGQVDLPSRLVRCQDNAFRSSEVSDKALPAPVYTLLSGFEEECKGIGGRLIGKEKALYKGNFNSDNSTDYVVYSGDLGCDISASFFTGNSGGDAYFFVSRRSTYLNAGENPAGGISVEGDKVWLSLCGIYCGDPNFAGRASAKCCERAFTWNAKKNKMVLDQAIPPRGMSVLRNQ